MSRWQKWVENLNKIPTWLKATIGYVSMLVGFVVLLRENLQLVIVIFILSASLYLLVAFVYIYISKTPPLIEGGRGVYRYSSYRPWALAGFVFVFLATFAAFFFQQSREYIYQGFVGTPEATLTPIVSTLATQDQQELYFSEETPGEPLIIIIPFSDDSNLGIAPEKRIERNLVEVISDFENYETRARIENYPTPVNTQNEAREIGRTYNATVVVWGWYDELGIQTFAEIIKSTPIKRAVGNELPNIPNPEQLLFCLRDGVPNQGTYLSLFALGIASYYAADFDQAIELFTLASDIPISDDCPTNVDDAILFRGKARMLAGYFDQAGEDFSIFISRKPDSIDGHLAMGFYQMAGCWTGLQVGNTYQAREEANYVINFDSQNSNAYLVLGMADICDLSNATGQAEDEYKEEAINNFNKAITLDPKNTNGYLFYALLQKDISLLSVAIEKYKQRIDLESNNCYLYSELGATLTTYNILSYLEEEACSYELFFSPSWGVSSECPMQEVGIDYSNSLIYFDKAIELCPYAPYSYAERGIAYVLMGECAMASQDFDTAESLNPHSGGAELIQEFKEWNSNYCIQN